MPKKERASIQFNQEEKDWHYKRIACDETLTINESVRQTTRSHPDYLKDMEDCRNDPEYALEYAALVKKGKRIAAKNKRR